MVFCVYFVVGRVNISMVKLTLWWFGTI